MSSRSTLRRLLTTALAALAALAAVPVAATAAQPAELRLLATEPVHSHVTITSPDGSRTGGTPGLFRLRVSPSGAPAFDTSGFCVDLRHSISEGRSYDVLMRTAADDPTLATPAYREAAWLLQSAEGLIAAAPSSARGLEAGALQVAVWQLVGEARQSAPTGDVALDARAAELRALSAGRAVGGPVTMTAEMGRGCAGRGAVRLRLTGVPGSTATLSASGAGVVSPAQVRFAADGTATATVASPAAGTVTVTARSSGGTLTRLARASSTRTTPQETIILVPAQHQATASIEFEDCPLTPLEEDESRPGPGTTPGQAPAETPDSGGAPLTPFETPSAAPPVTTPPATSTPTRSSPRLRVRKSGPRRVRAGARTSYVIRVTNRGRSVVRGVTVTDLLPDGMSLAGRPRGARLQTGRVVWRLSALRPGRTRALRVRVRLDAGIAGRRCNRVVVRMPGASTVGRASSCTRVLRVPRTLVPAVTS